MKLFSAVLVVVVYKSFKSQQNFLNLLFTCSFAFNFTKQSFQHYYQSYCNYLLRIGRMDGKQTAFEELT